MSATLAILTIGVVPVEETLPLLTEHVSAQQITHISLLGKMSPDEVRSEYRVEAGDVAIPTRLQDDSLGMLSRAKVERDLQSVIEVLDNPRATMSSCY